MSLAPIVLFTYNRLRHTKQTIEALQKNELATDSDLIIYSDGWKNEISEQQVKEVRCYLETIDGFNSIKIIEREKNWGLGNNIIDGVTTVVNQYGKIIVLEDDLLSSPFFLKFANEALTKYEKEEDVISISTYVYPLKERLSETFFIKIADCLGWATWKRGWDLFEPDGQKLLNELHAKDLCKEFDFNKTYPYTQMLKDQIAGKNSSWAIRWYASAFLNNKLTLYPSRSLIFHNGAGEMATNCQGDTSFLDVELSLTPIVLRDIPIEESEQGRIAFKVFFRGIELTFFQRIKNKLKSIFS